MKNPIPLLFAPSGDGTNLAAPVVSAVIPDTRYTEGGEYVVIQGSDLKNPTDVTIDGVSVTIVSSTRRSVTVLTAAHAAGGPFVVEVTTDLGSDTGEIDFAVVPTAAVGTPSPDYGPAAGGTTVTHTGATVVPELLSVTVGGVAATDVTWISSTSFSYVTPATAAGAKDIVLTMYGTGNDDTAVGGFTSLAAPVATSLDVTAGPIAGSTATVLTGTGFVTAPFGTNTVTLGGAACGVTYVNATTLNLTTPAGSVGSAALVVTNAGGTSNTLASAFTYYAVPTVVSSSVVPKTYALATVLTVSDSTGMTGGTLGGTALTGFSVLTGTTVAATFPGKTAGSHDLVLTGHPGGSTTAFPITVVNTNPVFTSVTPTTGATGGATALTIAGTGFSNGNATSVTIGGNACTSFTAVSDIEITCTSPAGTLGARTLLVVGPAGNSNSGTYTYSGYSPIDDSPIIWLRADMGVTLSGAEVTNWADQSGNGNDFERGLVGPTVNTSNSDFNGQYTLHFAGGVSAEALESSATISYGTHSTVIVCKTTTGLRLYVRYGSNQLSSVYVGGGPVQIVSGDNTNLDLRAAASFVDHPAYARIIGHRWDGTGAGHLLSEDGSDFSMTLYSSGSPSGSSVAGTFYLMSFTSTSEYVTGDIAEVCVFPDGTDLTDFITYATARYGL